MPIELEPPKLKINRGVYAIIRFRPEASSTKFLLETNRGRAGYRTCERAHNKWRKLHFKPHPKRRNVINERQVAALPGAPAVQRSFPDTTSGRVINCIMSLSPKTNGLDAVELVGDVNNIHSYSSFVIPSNLSSFDSVPRIRWPAWAMISV